MSGSPAAVKRKAPEGPNAANQCDGDRGNAEDDDRRESPCPGRKEETLDADKAGAWPTPPPLSMTMGVGGSGGGGGIGGWGRAVRGTCPWSPTSHPSHSFTHSFMVEEQSNEFIPI